jgi:hypothetical protein
VPRKVIVRSWDEALDVVDGKRITWEGVEGIVRIDRSRRFDTRFQVIPTPKGRRSSHYLEIKRQLHDDWDFDLTESPESSVKIAERFVRFEPVPSFR